MLMGISPPEMCGLGRSVASVPVADPLGEAGVAQSRHCKSHEACGRSRAIALSRLMMHTEWQPWCSIARVAGSLPRLGGQPTLRLKDPLAYDPGMGRGKLHDGAEDCDHPGMSLFIRGCHAGLWRVRVSWLVPHVATVLLQLNQLPVDQHARHDCGTEHLSLHRSIHTAEPENRRDHGGWRCLHCEP